MLQYGLQCGLQWAIACSDLQLLQLEAQVCKREAAVIPALEVANAITRGTRGVKSARRRGVKSVKSATRAAANSLHWLEKSRVAGVKLRTIAI